jgi:hypothetical protein
MPEDYGPSLLLRLNPYMAQVLVIFKALFFILLSSQDVTLYVFLLLEAYYIVTISTHILTLSHLWAPRKQIL